MNDVVKDKPVLVGYLWRKLVIECLIAWVSMVLGLDVDGHLPRIALTLVLYF